MRASRDFPCEPESVTAARHFVREVLDGQPQEVCELAELMASELATNSVRHARSDFEIAVRLGEEIRVEVRDNGSGEPARLSPSPEEPSGRGLLIVEAMADDWGVRRYADGKTVWFTLPGSSPRLVSNSSARRPTPCS
jgi:anti-sigma regulatory factor (Ser/Thr protein kinase)